MADSTSWQLALMRSRLNTLERKAERPPADAARLLGECVRELKHTFEFLEAAGERLATPIKLEEGAELRSSRTGSLQDPRQSAVRRFRRDRPCGVIVSCNAAAGNY